MAPRALRVPQQHRHCAVLEAEVCETGTLVLKAGTERRNMMTPDERDRIICGFLASAVLWALAVLLVLKVSQ